MADKTAVCYASKYGTTERYARIIADTLGGDTFDLNTLKKDTISRYDRIIIGSPIFAGRNPGKVKKFCEKNRGLLVTKKVGLYISCMAEGDESQKVLASAYPQWLHAHAEKETVLGGEILLSKLKGIHKLIITKMIKQEKDQSRFSEDQARIFAKEFS